MKIETRDLLPIGRFARLSGLTVKALRYYDEIGLLDPAWIDEGTGYRFYSLGQARDAEAIRRLRALEIPLDEIRSLLAAHPDTLRERLRVHRARLEGRAVETRRILAEFDRLIEGKESLVPKVEDIETQLQIWIEEVPEQKVVSIAETTHVDDMSTVVPRGIMTVGEYLKELGVRPSGAPLCICPFPDDDGMLTTELAWPITTDVADRLPIEVKTLPATRALVMKHVGPYEDLGRSYRLMSEAMKRHGLVPAGDPRETYETDPEEVPDPKDYVTLIQWPIGSEGDLK